jgi:hypothetical protein
MAVTFWSRRKRVAGAERWAARFGAFGIFAARLLPVVRHLIGIPAGIVRMDYVQYSIYTLIGSASWCAVLCWLGVKMGQDEHLMRGELHRGHAVARGHCGCVGSALLLPGASVHETRSPTQSAPSIAPRLRRCYRRPVLGATTAWGQAPLLAAVNPSWIACQAALLCGLANSDIGPWQWCFDKGGRAQIDRFQVLA